MSKKSILWLVLIAVLISCTVEPKKIEYGVDACAYCKMNIVDKQHAAQLVTKKGKNFKYDAIECMLHNIEALEEKNKKSFAYILVADYSNPGSLIDATSATYLISKRIKSPMGANLTAFGELTKANEFVKEPDDKVFNWEELKVYFYNN